jgi:hypothetical protein
MVGVCTVTGSTTSLPGFFCRRFVLRQAAEGDGACRRSACHTKGLPLCIAWYIKRVSLEHQMSQMHQDKPPW